MAAGRAGLWSQDELVATLESLDRLRAHTETLTLQVVLEIVGRGAHLETGLGTHDWLVLHCP